MKQFGFARSSSQGLGCVHCAIFSFKSALNISQHIAQNIGPANKMKYGSQWGYLRSQWGSCDHRGIRDGAMPCSWAKLFCRIQVYRPVTFALFNVMFYSSITELTNHREQSGTSVSCLKEEICLVYGGALVLADWLQLLPEQLSLPLPLTALRFMCFCVNVQVWILYRL